MTFDNSPYIEEILPIFDGNRGWLSPEFRNEVFPERSASWEELGYECLTEIAAPNGDIFIWLVKL